jgi:ATPase family AAA domain-containing protein 3A/B
MTICVGTGKTLIARKLAEVSGMDYAIMSGGDVGPLGDDAVTQLHAVFKWASRSTRGLLVFIDESEAFLSARSSLFSQDDSSRRHALNALLYQTGTQSKSFMLGRVYILLDRKVIYLVHICHSSRHESSRRS